MRHRSRWWLGALALVVLGGCSHTLEGPEPAVTGAAEPHLVCNAQLTTPVLLTGEGFSPLPVDTALDDARLILPTISLEQTGDLTGGAASGAAVEVPDDATMPESSQVRWLSQTQMAFDVTESLALAEGIHAIAVENPNGNAARFEAALAVVPPPTLDRVEPMAICVAQGAVMLELFGTGLLRMANGDLPEIALEDEGGSVIATYEPISMDGCATLPAPATDAESCSSAVIEIPTQDVEPATYRIILRNPPPASCMSTEAITVDVVPPPDLTDVTPSTLCVGGGTLGLLGTGFRNGATVTAGGVEASSVSVEAGGEAATATFGMMLGAGTYDVTIENPEGCSDTLEDSLEVIQGPIMFFVDPPVVYSGISTQVTIYISGATSVDEVSITPEGGGTPVVLDHSFDMARGRILAVVPSGTTAGTYDVSALSGGCGTMLPGGLAVTDDLTLTVDSIDPRFGQDTTDTPVAIAGGSMAGTADDFVSTPRAYLNPATPSATSVARALSSVAFVDGNRLTGVVGAGLPTGLYDLVVINPSGEVGLLEDAFTVTAAAPPVIDFVAPGEVANDADGTLSVTGSGFATPEAAWSCLQPDGTTLELDGTVPTSDGVSAQVTIPSSGLSSETVCVLRLTNPDGSYGDFSAVAVTAPSSNLANTVLTSEMTTGRAGLSLVAARATRQARFLHALGGDDGVGTALATSESVTVDPFGVAGTWFEQPNGLPGAITDGGAAVIGRQIYLVGGHDGSTPLSTVWRTEVLDPSEAPTVTDVTPRRATTESGLGEGVWYYRVSAVMPSTHPTNPSGETLASDPFVIDLPRGLPSNLVITLFWSEVAGAESYRIYRSPDPDLASGSERLLTTLDASSREYEDDGSGTPSGDAPLPIGAHGTWVAMPSLATARSGVRVGLAEAPMDPSVRYLYAIGGDDGAGPLATYELLGISVAADGTQTVDATWTPGAESIGEARSYPGVYVADRFSAPESVGLGTSYLYVVGGVRSGGMASSDAAAALVGADGQLGAFAAIDSLSPRNAGFAHTAGNGFFYVFGGGPSPRSTAASAEVCHGGCSAPDVINWNNQGFNTTSARWRGAGAVESAHVFVVGGQATSGGAALSTAETTVW